MDILFVIGGLDVGGTERHLLLAASALRRAGWRVCIYSLAGNGPLRRAFEAADVEVFLPPVSRNEISEASIPRAWRLFLAATHLTYVMICTNPRITHFFLPAAYLVGGIAASLARVKIRVMSRRSMNIYQRGYPIMRWLELKLHGRMDAILGNSGAVIRQLLDEEHVPKRKLGLIYNGIGPVRVAVDRRAAVRSSLAIEESTLVFVIVANLIPYKGHLDLIAAMGIADEAIGQPWHLLIAGRDDGAGPSILAMAEKLNIDEKITIMGARSDIADLLSASDIGLLCSHQEGFSNAILEAMAAGLPMIVTNVGGNAEAVVDGKTGLVVPPRDPPALADAVVLLAGDRSLRESYGKAGRERVEENFTLGACVAKYESLYRGLIAKESPGDILAATGRSFAIASRPRETLPSRPLVSIIMSMRDSAKTVHAAVRSLQLQSLEDWELIVIDDGSRDQSAMIVESFHDRRIRLIRETRSAGLATRLNQAVTMSRGDFIARMDADDLCFPNRLELQVAYLQQNPGVDLLGCGAVVFTDNAHLIGTLPVGLSHDSITSHPFFGFPFPHPTWCGRAEWFRNNPYNGALMKAQDQDLLLRSFAHSRFEAHAEVLVGYRQDVLHLGKMLQGRKVFISSLWRYGYIAGKPVVALVGVAMQALKSVFDIVSITLGLNRRAQRSRLKPVPPVVVRRWLELQSQLDTRDAIN
jgi:glycosyltransferase involved in cell wall biosynthesis